MLNFLDLGDSFSIFFFGKVMDRVISIERDYSNGKKKKDYAITDLQRLQWLVEYYNVLIKQHYFKFKSKPKLEDAQLDAF